MHVVYKPALEPSCDKFVGKVMKWAKVIRVACTCIIVVHLSYKLRSELDELIGAVGGARAL